MSYCLEISKINEVVLKYPKVSVNCVKECLDNKYIYKKLV